jgi:hypothetical protein
VVVDFWLLWFVMKKGGRRSLPCIAAVLACGVGFCSGGNETEVRGAGSSRTLLHRFFLFVLNISLVGASFGFCCFE